ncbi:trypsin/chymotrypsin inhibitor-like [Wolffia australiana]
MKPSRQFLLGLFRLLVCLPLLAAQELVLDSDSEPLQRGRLYYAVSLGTRATDGGLILVSANESCPSHVAKAEFSERLGQALALFPENPNSKTVTAGQTLYVRFAARPACSAGSSALWRVNPDGEGFVTTGGSVSASVGPHDSRFAIVAPENIGVNVGVYEIHACPCSVGVDRGSCRMGCLGGLGAGNSSLLSLGADTPHRIVFVKA